MAADLLWVRENVLPPAYRGETDFSCACQAGVCWHCRDGRHVDCYITTGWWRPSYEYEETRIADSLGRPVSDDKQRSAVLVWLADRTCQITCPCPNCAQKAGA